MNALRRGYALGHDLERPRLVHLEVLGTPAPKGSSRAMIRGGHAVNVPSGSEVNRRNLKGWDAAVREAAASFVGDVAAPPFVKVALHVQLTFRLTRPGGHWGEGKRAGQLKASAPLYPAGKPDADKLTRATLDSMTGIVFDDDSRIVRLVVEKLYARPGEEGATITVEEME